MMHLTISPLGIGLIVGAIRLVGNKHWGKKTRQVMHGVIALCIVLMTPLGANALVAAVERQTKATTVCSAHSPPTDIVLLSGGFSRPPTNASDFSALNSTSLQRLSGAVDLWHQYPNARLVISGGGVFKTKESEVLADLATRFGVPRSSIEIELGSQSTWENAASVAELKPPISQQIWLVTSALHLPRAMFAFVETGFTPCAYPAYSSYLAPGGIPYYLPQISALQKSEEALHELVGILVYRLHAWRQMRPNR